MVTLPIRNSINFIILRMIANWYTCKSSMLLQDLVFIAIETSLHPGPRDFINAFYEYYSVFRILF